MESLSQFIYQFGDKRHVIILLVFLMGFTLICAAIKHNKLRLASSVLASSFISAQVFSLYSTQSFIGYQFYIHMNLRDVAGMQSLFVSQMTVLSIFFIVLSAFNYYAYKQRKKVTSVLNIEKAAVITQAACLLVFIGLIIIDGGFVKDTQSLTSIFASNYNNSEKFEDVLLKNKMSDYITPNEIESSAGKNIIIISMESLERGFLNKKHAALTPNLNELKTNWNYRDIRPNCGSGWTSGSLYTYLTGFPAFFGSPGNDIFKNAYHSNISSVSHVLGKSNYKTVYLNGNTDHSGVNSMLSVFQFNKIIDVKNTPDNGHQSKYGLRDMDLFSLAKSEVNTLKGSNNPYAIFISTTDSHFPDGIYDKRMEAFISPKKSNFEFTVASLDYLIGDFISYLEEEGLLTNTVVYLFPDHLKMGDPTIFMNTGERGLYLLTNASNEDIGKDSTNNTYQIDLPKFILNGAKIEHNLKFLTDYIQGDKDAFIRKNINSLTEINRVGLTRLDDEVYIVPEVSKRYAQYRKDTLRYIAHAGGIIGGRTYTNSLEALNLSYSKGFRLFELDIRETKDNKYVAVHEWDDWKKMTGYTGPTPVTHQVFMKFNIHEKFTPLSMAEINQWFTEHTDAILVTDKINEPKSFSNQFVDPNRLMMELFTKEAVEEGVEAGILSAIPTQHIIEDLSWNSIVDLEIKHVAVSRFFISTHKELLKKLKDQGINVYVYHINQDGDVTDSGMDEEYVT